MTSAQLSIFGYEPPNPSSAAASKSLVSVPSLGLRPYQESARMSVADVHTRHRGALAVLATGCHRAEQLVMRADGCLARADAVQVGWKLMGPDGSPRVVERLERGRGQMVRIVPIKGESWVVNLDHVLTLVRTSQGGPCPSQQGGALVDVSVREWMGWSKTAKHLHKLLRCAIDFPPRQPGRVGAYMLGVLLGDGSLQGGVSVCTPDSEIWAEARLEASRWGLAFVERKRGEGECPTFAISAERGHKNPLLDELRCHGVAVRCDAKFIPDAYKLGSKSERLEVLAGLLDTDGHLVDGTCFDFISISRRLSEDVAFVARSLGLAAYVSECRKGCQTGAVGTYWRVSISGDVSILPLRVVRKQGAERKQKKSVLRTGFSVELLDEEDYFGWTVDGDSRYLLGDFTVTHNCGKTRLAGAVIWDWKAQGRKSLVLCPTIVLCQQMHSDLRKLGLRSDIEQAENHVERWSGAPLADVVVASVATMRGKRLESFKPDAFGLVVTDEAHRSISKQYQAIYDHFAPAKMLGLTATPDRVDGISLANVFDEVAFNMPMLDGIRDGWLVPLRFKTAHTDFDAAHIRTVAGEVDAGSVAEELVRSGALHQAANTMAELAEGERTVAFLPTVAASKAFVAELLARGVSACHIDGETPQETREDAFKKLTDGDLRVLSNVGVLIEGFDCPVVSVIALLNPTKSRSRLTQMIGRGTRLAPGKTSTLVIDFCPGRLRKGRLASPADALAGKMLSDDEYDNLASEGDLVQAVADAEQKAAELEAKRAKAKLRAEQRRARIESMKRLSTKQQFDYTTEEHSAEDILQAEQERRLKLEDSVRKMRGEWSAKQENMIRKLGYRGAPLDRFTASSLVGEVFARKSAGMGWGLSPETWAKLDARGAT